MRAALALHDVALRRAIDAHGGVWFKRVGDAVQAAFATAADAVAAAADAQRGLSATAWGPDGPLAVRMAVHAGEATPHGGDYVAPCLNRLARLMAAGHGGQILLSQAVVLLMRDDVPPGVTIESLGTHRLRDLMAPEDVFQATVDGLPGVFGALRTLDARPNNLPQALTPLVDRAQELTALGALLDRAGVRLVALTGPGGIGKSRLALQAAAEALDAFPDGAWFVPLAAVHDPALVLPALAAALAVREGGGAPLAAALAAHLAARRTLVILDNVEQVLGVGPDLVALLEACPGLKLVVTSRSPLRVRGEHELAVGPLALPAAPGDGARDGGGRPNATGGAGRPETAAAIAGSPAVMLFVGRAQALSAAFGLTDDNAAAVAEICRRLDGVPLAIELAAARTRLLPPAALLKRLEGRLSELGGGLRDLPPRQQTLAATLDWSHALLDPDQRALFRRLAVFRGGWTIELAEAVCASDVATGPEAPDPHPPRIDVFDGLAALADLSLIQAAPARAHGEARFSMFRVVAEYAAERLAEAGEADAIALRHAAAMTALADQDLRHSVGEAQAERLDRLAAEHANLGAALDWLIAHGNGDAALALAADLWRYWYLRGHLQEGRSALGRALACPGAAPVSEARARVANGLGVLAWLQGDFAAARASLEEARAIAASLGDDARLLRINHNLGIVAVDEGDLATAAALAESNLVVARRVGDRHAEAGVLHALGALAAEQADFGAARARFTDALAIQRELDDREGAAATLINLAELCLLAGDLEGAARCLDEGEPLANAVHDIWTLGTIHLRRGELALADGRLGDARRALAAAARQRIDAGDQKGLSRALPPVARLALAVGDADSAARLLGAASALRARIGAPLLPREVLVHDADVAAVRAALGAAAFEAAWAAGATLSPEAAIALVLDAGERG